MDNFIFIICSVAGLFLVVGSLLLLWKGRIYLDKEGTSVSKIELPFGIKFSTQFPVLIMFFFGLVALLYPLYNRSEYYYSLNLCPQKELHNKTFPQMVELRGKVESAKPIDVYAVVAGLDKARNELILQVPFKAGLPYRLIYSDGRGGMIPSDPFTLENIEPRVLDPIKIQGEQAAAVKDPAPITSNKALTAGFK